MAGRSRHVTFSQFVKEKSDGEVAYGWLEDRYFQVCQLTSPPHVDHFTEELMVLAHEVIMTRAVDNLIGESSSANRPKYEFKRSASLRVLFTFKPHEHRQHLVIPTQSSSCSSLSLCAFVSNYGRQVFSFLDSPTQGSGYKSFKVLSDALHVYVDAYELTSPLGIFRVLAQLDPSHKCSLDIASYFQGQKENVREDEGLLAEVPVAGLRSKGGNRGGTKRKGKESSSKSSSSTNQPPQRQTRSTTRKRAGQPTIAESLAGPQTKKPKSIVDQYTEDLPASVIDELFDFESQPSGGVAPAISVEATHPELEGGKEKCTSDGRDHSKDLSGGVALAISVEATCPELEGGKEKRTSDGRDHSKDLFGASEMEAEDRVTEKMDNSDLVDAAIFDIPTPPLISSPPPRTLSDRTNTPTSSPVKPQQKDLQTLIPHPHVDGGNDTPLQQALMCGNEHLPPLSSSEATSCSIDEDDAILISSGDESTKGSQKEDEAERRRKTRKVFDPIKKFKGKSCIKDLTLKDVHRWLCSQKETLILIFQRKIYSRRHEDYVAGGKKNAALHYQLDTRLFTKGQVNVITNDLMKVFCRRHMKYYSYAMSVLFPECLIRLIMDFNQIDDFDVAERMMYLCGAESETECINIS